MPFRIVLSVKGGKEKLMHKENTYEEVITRNSDMVYRLAYSLVRTRADADDIYQEVFMRYIKAGPVFDNEGHEKAWLVRVTVNCCKNYWKSPWMRRRAAFHEETALYEKEAAGEKMCTVDSGLIWGEGEVGNSEEQLLIETVKELPEKYRVVIHLFYYEEMSVEEIGKITGMKASAVRTRLTRARKRLKEKLGGL